MTKLEFNKVPREVKANIRNGIFWCRYTHTTGTRNRDGIEKTGKIMAPALARAAGIIPFSGELIAQTFMFRMYYVSLANFPPDDIHSWHFYIPYGKIR